MLVYVAWFWLGGPLLLAWGVVQLVRLARKRINHSSLFHGLKILGAAVLFSVMSLVVGEGVGHAKREQRKEFVQRAVPLVDAYHASHGNYPIFLNEVSDVEIPFLVGSDLSYSSNGERFEFVYFDNQSLMGGLLYSSSTRKWSRWS